MGAACPICGDEGRYALWVDPEPPPGCADDPAAMRGEARTVTNVTECAYAMKKAEQRAHWRKSCPESFDHNGNMLPGQLAHVLEVAMRPGEELVI